MSIIQMHLSTPTSAGCLSSVNTISGSPARLFLAAKFATLSLTTTTPPPKVPFKTTTIRMGGGPRTYPGGVSKWQWKRMQAKKAKQLLKARLARERQIYEMRKRAELKAAVLELERPWEAVEKAPTMFSVGADEQLKVLADRFQRPGGFDMWSEKDGPELFKPDDGLPSARFFPKGVVHSIKPYGKIERIGNGSDGHPNSGSGRATNDDIANNDNNFRKGSIESKGERNADWNLAAAMREVGRSVKARKNSKEMVNEQRSEKSFKNNMFKKRRNRRMYSTDSEEMSPSEVKDSNNAEVYDLRLQKDGHYEFRPEN